MIRYRTYWKQCHWYLPLVLQENDNKSNIWTLLLMQSQYFRMDFSTMRCLEIIFVILGSYLVFSEDGSCSHLCNGIKYTNWSNCANGSEFRFLYICCPNLNRTECAEQCNKTLTSTIAEKFYRNCSTYNLTTLTTTTGGMANFSVSNIATTKADNLARTTNGTVPSNVTTRSRNMTKTTRTNSGITLTPTSSITALKVDNKTARLTTGKVSNYSTTKARNITTTRTTNRVVTSMITNAGSVTRTSTVMMSTSGTTKTGNTTTTIRTINGIVSSNVTTKVNNKDTTMRTVTGMTLSSISSPKTGSMATRTTNEMTLNFTSINTTAKADNASSTMTTLIGIRSRQTSSKNTKLNRTPYTSKHLISCTWVQFI